MAYATNNGTHIHYQVEGAGGAPLVLHHGFGDSLASWYDYGYVAALQEHCRLILVDGRGHGGSDKPYHPDAYGLAPRAADITAVLDAEGIDRAHYFGYSMGGWIGFGLARHAPERLASLILGGAQPYGQSMAFYRTGLQEGLSHWADLVSKLAEPLPFAADRIYRNDARALYAAVARDRPDISDQLPSMTMPCLLFAGDADPLHDLVERCARKLPNGHFVSLPGCNHIQSILRRDLLLPHITGFLAAVASKVDRHPAAPV